MKIFVSLLALFTLIALPLIAQETGNDGVRKSEKPKTIKVLFGVAPKGLKVNVYHGKTKLGETPFEHEFVRNSGPVDIVFKRAGYFNVNTRVFTYDDSKLIVKMTSVKTLPQLYGYREEIPLMRAYRSKKTRPLCRKGLRTLHLYLRTRYRPRLNLFLLTSPPKKVCL